MLPSLAVSAGPVEVLDCRREAAPVHPHPQGHRPGELFLLLGAIVNVAVAWSITLRHGSLIGQVMLANRRELADDEAQWYSDHEARLSLLQWMAAQAVLATPTAKDERGPGWWQTTYIEEFRGAGGQLNNVRTRDGTVLRCTPGSLRSRQHAALSAAGRYARCR